jgi:hypothetical protein
MIRLFRNFMTGIEAVFSSSDKVLRAIGERANRRRTQRWMNG